MDIPIELQIRYLEGRLVDAFRYIHEHDEILKDIKHKDDVAITNNTNEVK